MQPSRKSKTGHGREKRTDQIPLGNDPLKASAVVRAVARNPQATQETIGQAVGLSDRHTDYYAHAARCLGWLEREGKMWTVTAAGQRVAEADPEKQRALFIKAIKNNAVLRELVLEGPDTIDGLAKQIRRFGFSDTSAKRRASTIRAWRAYTEAP